MLAASRAIFVRSDSICAVSDWICVCCGPRRSLHSLYCCSNLESSIFSDVTNEFSSTPGMLSTEAPDESAAAAAS